MTIFPDRRRPTQAPRRAASGLPFGLAVTDTIDHHAIMKACDDSTAGSGEGHWYDGVDEAGERTKEHCGGKAKSVTKMLAIAFANRGGMRNKQVLYHLISPSPGLLAPWRENVLPNIPPFV
ncbi:hypothetical protein [Sphingopyxis sp. 113P3]|uniref:hypothetical protein n=1 Tax=Sphingopyxis sp. (strain 113P3) TaxID=292913 RepID=UPI00130DBF8E